MTKEQIEKAAEKYVEERWWKIVRGWLNRLNHAFTHGVKWAERWIPVEEELPPIGKDVTVLLKGKDENGKDTFNVHTFDEIVSYKRLKGWFDFYGFTHWRPIEHK